MTLAQTILVTKSGTSTDTVRAAAAASVTALAAAEGPSEAWGEWSAGSHTKVVKQTSRAKIERALETLPEGRAAVSGDVLAAAFPPMPQEVLHAHGGPLGGHLGVRREAPEVLTGALDPSLRLPALLINAALDMSTGKAAAQAAHAYVAAFQAGLLPLPDLADTQIAWAAPDLFERLARLPLTMRVVDNGLTEVPPGSTTAAWVIHEQRASA